MQSPQKPTVPKRGLDPSDGLFIGLPIPKERPDTGEQLLYAVMYNLLVVRAGSIRNKVAERVFQERRSHRQGYLVYDQLRPRRPRHVDRIRLICHSSFPV